MDKGEKVGSRTEKKIALNMLYQETPTNMKEGGVKIIQKKKNNSGTKIDGQ